MPRLVARHSLITRFSHWANVPILAVMTWSGVAISGAKTPYTVTVGETTLMTLFPEAFFRELSFPDLAAGMGWHFTFAWLLLANAGVYALGLMGSGSWRSIVPRRVDLRGAWNVIRAKEAVAPSGEDPAHKYNGAQKIAYSAALLMGFGLVATGLAIFRPIQLAPLVRLLGGYQAARFEHFWLTMAMIGFVLVHVIQALLAGWNTFRGMVIGVELVRDPGGDP